LPNPELGTSVHIVAEKSINIILPAEQAKDIIIPEIHMID